MKLTRKDKENLFKTGIPFEVSVNQYFAKLGFWVNPEFSYLRNDKEFSIDAEVTLINNRLKNTKTDSIWLKILLECKFTTNSRNKWVFFTYGNKVKKISRNEVLIFPFEEQDRISKPSFLNETKLASLLKQTPVVWKGTTLTENDATTSYIKEAISQLQFSYIHALNEFIDFKMPYDFVENREHILLPLVVTNNPLYYSNFAFNVENINHLQDVNIHKAKWLIVDAGFSNELLEYNRNEFTKKYKEIIEKKKKIFVHLSEDEFNQDIRGFEKKYLKVILAKIENPRYVWIVNSDHLEEFMKKLLSLSGVNILI